MLPRAHCTADIDTTWANGIDGKAIYAARCSRIIAGMRDSFLRFNTSHLHAAISASIDADNFKRL